MIRFAAANRLCIDLDYQGSIRRIEPYSLRRTRDGNIILHAFNTDKNAHRSYRVDRISGASTTNESFIPRYEIELTPQGPVSIQPTARRSTGLAPRVRSTLQPKKHLREIVRVLAPGGRFVLSFRPGDDAALAAQFPASVYHMRSAAEIEAILADCGFDEIRTVEHHIGARTMAWVIAHKAGVQRVAYKSELMEKTQCVS